MANEPQQPVVKSESVETVSKKDAAPQRSGTEIRSIGRAKILIHIRGNRRQADEEFIIRPVRPTDFEQMIHVHREVYPPPYLRSNHWTEVHLQSHYMKFREGQFCIEYVNDGTLVGSSVCMRIQRARARRRHTYNTITGNQMLSTHDPEGNALYGVDICVSPHFRGKGLAKALYDRRLQLMRELGLRHFLAGARIPGFAGWSEKNGGDVEAYVKKVVDGELFDETLSVQLKVGFKAVSILPRYMRDPDSMDFAVLIEFEDPAPAVAPPATKPPVGASPQVKPQQEHAPIKPEVEKPGKAQEPVAADKPEKPPKQEKPVKIAPEPVKPTDKPSKNQ